MVMVCSFTAVPDVTRKTRYADLKAAVLKAGRFSVFEATANRWSAALFDELSRDPELLIDTARYGYPWTAVSLRVSAPASGGEK